MLPCIGDILFQAPLIGQLTLKGGSTVPTIFRKVLSHRLEMSFCLEDQIDGCIVLKASGPECLGVGSKRRQARQLM